MTRHATRARFGVRHRRAVAVLLCTAAVSGCGADYASAAAPVDRSQLLASVVLDHHAIVISTAAPWNTIHLAATPTNPDGVPLAGLAGATYSLSDSGSVTITPNGQLTALAPSSGVRVVASISDGNVTRTDSAFVYVTDTPAPPTLATFSIQPLPGDSAKMAPADPFGLYGQKQMVVQATAEGGAPIDALPAYFTTSDQSVATVDPAAGLVFAIRPGTVVIHASTTAYGVSMTDSLVLTVIPPLIGGVALVERTPVGSTTPVLAFDPDRIVVSVGATVLFANNSIRESTGIVFDDPANVAESPLLPTGAGDIPPFHADENGSGLVTRAFFTPGTYTFHSTTFDTHGTIVVQ